MALADKSLLLITDDPQLSAEVQAALKPLVKGVIAVKNSEEAFKKVQMQSFDAFLLRNQKPILLDPKQLFAWTQTQKDFKSTPWVVLGKDVEDESVVVAHHHVKFVDDPHDMAGLVKMLNGIFFAPSEGASKGRAGVDVNFINPVVKAVVEVIRSMAQIELERGQPYLKKSGEASTKADISGLIAMNSNRFVGSMAICLQESLAKSIYQNMLGTPVETLDDDVKDAVSELTNIIFGNAKRDLNSEGHTIAPAIPSVITGPQHEIRHSIDGHRFCIPFSAPAGTLVIECVISMKG